MKIGIIGSGLSGLVAGKELAKTGHEVIIFEKKSKHGGRLATTCAEDDATLIDYGSGYITAQDPVFISFVEELIENELLTEWTDHFQLYDGVTMHNVNPNVGYGTYYAATKGMSSIANYLSRWVDIRQDAKVGGLTHIGRDRNKKRSWMLNLTDFSVVELDAVIIATPAVEAYGLIHMTQDETPSKKISSVIDEIKYEASYSLMYGYKGKDQPDWNGIEVSDEVITWISNESSKPRPAESTAIVAKSTSAFAKKYKQADEETVVSLMEEKLQKIFKNDYHFPEWRKLQHWKYERVINPIDDFYLEMEMQEAPLSLIGNYYKSSTIEAAYLSGYKLAKHWAEKYKGK